MSKPSVALLKQKGGWTCWTGGECECTHNRKSARLDFSQAAAAGAAAAAT